MKTNKEVSVICKNVTDHNHFNIDRVMELNHVRDCIVDILSKCYHINKHLHVRVLGVIDDISLMVIDGKVGNFFHEKKLC